MQSTVACAPRNDRAHSNLATTLLDAGRTEEAIAELYTALRLNPHIGLTYLKMGIAYLRLAEVDRAIGFLEQAVELSDAADCQDYLGQALFQKGDYPGAADHYQKALDSEPGNADLHFRFANVLCTLQRPEEARQHYEEALRLAPETQRVHINLAAVLAAQGKPGEALEHCQKALAILPNTAEEHFNLAQNFFSLGRLDEAIVAYREAIRMAPEMAEPYAAIAKVLCSKRDTTPEERAEALRLAQRANDLTNSARADVIETLAMSQAALGNFERAADLVEEALKLPGPNKNQVFGNRLRAQLLQYRRSAGQ